jgi:hypothetical protein
MDDSFLLLIVETINGKHTITSRVTSPAVPEKGSIVLIDDIAYWVENTALSFERDEFQWAAVYVHPALDYVKLGGSKKR